MKTKLGIGLLLLAGITITMAFKSNKTEDEELKAKIENFIKSQSGNYELKTLNIDVPDIGSIDETEFDWQEEYLFKSKEKVYSEFLERDIYQKIYMSVFKFEDEKQKQFAFDAWLKCFIGCEKIRETRDYKRFEGAIPMYAAINSDYIIVLSMKCSSDAEGWKDFKKAFYDEFINYKTQALDADCEGPIKWKNKPDDGKKKKKRRR